MMTGQKIAGLACMTIGAGIMIAGYLKGARFPWWEPVISAEGITYALFRSI